MLSDVPTLLVLFVTAAAGLAWWLHRLDVLRSLFGPAMERHRENQIASRTESLRHRAWDQNEHADDRDLAARLQDSIHVAGTDAFAEEDAMVLPGGIGPMPTEWREPEPPEAPR